VVRDGDGVLREVVAASAGGDSGAGRGVFWEVAGLVGVKRRRCALFMSPPHPKSGRFGLRGLGSWDSGLSPEV